MPCHEKRAFNLTLKAPSSSQHSSRFKPPQHIGGMTSIHSLREQCTLSIHTLALLLPIGDTGPLLKQLRKLPASPSSLTPLAPLSLPRLKAILNPTSKDLLLFAKCTALPSVPPLSASTHRLLLLDPCVAPSHPQLAQLLTKPGYFLAPYTLTLDYDYWQFADIVSALIPPPTPPPLAFETVGHIAHLNLRQGHEPYKKLIGHVLLDKSPGIKTVVNKTENIGSVYRVFEMEVLAGEANMVTTVKEDGCSFTFDYSQVYWNSRLQHEHFRLSSLFQPGERIADVMAGVGPFAIPAAKRKDCLVYANDLNPASYKYLQDNVQANGVAFKVRCYNLDARAFIQQSLLDLNKPHSATITTNSNDSSNNLTRATSANLDNANTVLLFNHYILNLPATAIEFLDAFRGLLTPYFSSKKDVLLDDAAARVVLPTIHVYCFVSSANKASLESMSAEAIGRVMKVLKVETLVADDEGSGAFVHRVRDVAPGKEMVCVSFKLPRAVAFADRSDDVMLGRIYHN